ncbi:MAG: Mur ligase family protein [Patescibacteria group bacterium]
MESYRDKKVLIFGLGILGGGVATSNWFLKQGAKLLIVDAKTREELASSIAQLSSDVELCLGGAEPSLEGIDTLVLNPGVSFRHPLVLKARERGIHVVNEATIFYNNFPGKIIGITGTRGKTTTATWTAHLMGDQAVLAGNSPEHPFLKVLSGETAQWAVTEVSSFHLELFDETVRPPDIAVLTNIYQDHLNRYGSMEEYAETKKNLYRWQKPGQKLITGNEHIPLDVAGFAEQWGEHNLINLCLAARAAHEAGVPWDELQTRIATLPQIPFRQQVVYEDGHLIVINDTAATSPEGGIAALERFGGPDTVLIAGGTDRELDFTEWNKVIAQTIKKKHVILLAGSATKKMLEGTTYETLDECLQAALALHPKIILFSPACKSFEKFKNEYDRGEQFNALVKKHLPSHKTPHISL